MTDSLFKDLSIERLKLRQGQVAAYPAPADTEPGQESVIFPLVGTVGARIGEREFSGLGGRRDVFSELPFVLCIPARLPFSLWAESYTADVILARAKSEMTFLAPVPILPSDIHTHDIGEGHAYRQVREIVTARHAARLRIGETLSPPGVWSSWPPHSFDADPKLAPEFEEAMFFLTKPKGGWALTRRQGLFVNGDPVDDVAYIRHGEFMVMPLGEHPIVASPAHALYYWWCYISPVDKKYAEWSEDGNGYA